MTLSRDLRPRSPGRWGRRGGHAQAFCLLGFVVLVALSCGDDDGGTGPPPWSPAPIDIPLSVGSRWTYDVRDTVSGQPRPFYQRIDSVAVRREFGGESFSGVVSLLDGDPADTAWWRASGQTVFLRIGFGDPGSDPLSREIVGQLERSLPWKALDFAASPGTAWPLAGGQADGEVNGIPVHVALSVTAESKGRWNIVTPSGTWTDVHHGRLSIILDIVPDMIGPSTTVRNVQQIDFFVRDDVGIVRQRVQGRLEVEGEDPEILYASDAGLRGHHVSLP